jgi:hypothetical protein
VYFDFKDGENISRRQFIADRYMQISKKDSLPQRDDLNNITYTCSRLGRKHSLKIFSWVNLEAFSVV